MGGAAEERRRGARWMLAACWLLLALLLLRFALVQDVWIDESTQLSGIALSPGGIITWLAGKDQGRFGVPGDRMPPVSYLLDWLWARIVSPAPVSLRLFHAGLTLGGVVVLTRAAARHLGDRTAIVAALLFALSTKLIQAGVEIRAYPIFFALTCAQLAMFLRLVTDPDRVRPSALLPIAATAVVAIYTHFFATVAWAALAAGLTWRSRRDPRGLLSIVAVSFGIGVLSLGLLPFALASSTLSSAEAANLSGRGGADYLLHLLGGSPELVWPVAGLAFVAGAALLLTASALPGRDDAAKARHALLVGVAAGVAMTVAAAAVATAVQPLKPSYSIWALPFLILLIAAGWSRPTGFAAWDRCGRHAALALAVLGTGVASTLVAARPTLFIHGPGGFLAREYRAAQADRLIYERDAQWGYGYFPLRFAGKGSIEQWRGIDARVALIGEGGDPNLPSVPLGDAVATANRVVVANIRLDTYRELRRYLHGEATGIAPGPVARALASDSHWRLKRVAEQPGYYSVRLWRFERVR